MRTWTSWSTDPASPWQSNIRGVTLIYSRLSLKKSSWNTRKVRTRDWQTSDACWTLRTKLNYFLWFCWWLVEAKGFVVSEFHYSLDLLKVPLLLGIFTSLMKLSPPPQNADTTRSPAVFLLPSTQGCCGAGHQGIHRGVGNEERLVLYVEELDVEKLKM